MPEEQKDVTSVQLEDMVDALRSRVGGVNVQFSFIPATNSVEYVRELISSAQRMGQFAGAVPISCPRAVYKYLEEVGGPMVVRTSSTADSEETTIDASAGVAAPRVRRPAAVREAVRGWAFPGR